EEFTASTSFPFPQRDLWVELPRDAWDQTRTTPTLEVRYVPGAPQINRAEADEPESMLAVLLFAPFGLALAVLLVTASWRGWIAPD
ncbi:MAG TPA: hypothetical protein VLT47_14730, partial [Anaeromyxobacteraceae bacterium]|nr:hypothetical protein [Anaeromyxobacteraceae bacterium]